MGTSLSCPTDCLHKVPISTMPAVATRSRTTHSATTVLETSLDGGSHRIFCSGDDSWELQPRCSILWRPRIGATLGIGESLQIDRANSPQSSPQSPTMRNSRSRRGSDGCVYNNSDLPSRDSSSPFAFRAPFLEPPPLGPHASTISNRGLGAVKMRTSSEDHSHDPACRGSKLNGDVHDMEVGLSMAASSLSPELVEVTEKGCNAGSRTNCGTNPTTASVCNDRNCEAAKELQAELEAQANDCISVGAPLALKTAHHSDDLGSKAISLSPCEASIDQPAAQEDVSRRASSLGGNGGEDVNTSSCLTSLLISDLKEEVVAERDRAAANQRLASAALRVLALGRLATQPPSLKSASVAAQDAPSTNEASRLPPCPLPPFPAPRRSPLGESSSPTVLATTRFRRRRLRPRSWAAGTVDGGSSSGGVERQKYSQSELSEERNSVPYTAAWPFAGLPPSSVGPTQSLQPSTPICSSSPQPPLPKPSLRPFYEQSMPIPRLDPGLLSSPRLCAHPSAAASAAALHYLLPHPPPSPLQASHTINFSSSSSQGASQRYGSTPRSSLRGPPSSVPEALSPSALVLGDLAAMGKLADSILMQLCDELADELFDTLDPEARRNLLQSSDRAHRPASQHDSNSEAVAAEMTSEKKHAHDIARNFALTVDPLHALTPPSSRPHLVQPHSAPAALASSSGTTAAPAYSVASPSIPLALAWSPRPSRSPARKGLPRASLATSSSKVAPTSSSTPNPELSPAFFSPRTPLSPFTPSSPPPPGDSIHQKNSGSSSSSSSSGLHLECKPENDGEDDGEDEDCGDFAAATGRAGRGSFEDGLLSPHLAALLDDSDGDRFVSGGALETSMPLSWADEASIEEDDDGDRDRWRPRASSRHRSGHFDDLLWGSPSSPHDTPSPNGSPLMKTSQKGPGYESFEDRSSSCEAATAHSNSAVLVGPAAEAVSSGSTSSPRCGLGVHDTVSLEAVASRARAVNEAPEATVVYASLGPEQIGRGNDAFTEVTAPFSQLEDQDGAILFRHAPCP